MKRLMPWLLALLMVGGACSSTPDTKDATSTIQGGNNTVPTRAEDVTDKQTTEFVKVYGDAVPAPPVGNAWAIASEAKLIVGTNGVDIVAWDVRTGEEVERGALPSPLDEAPDDAMVSPDGTIFGARTSSDAWLLWDRSTTPPTRIDKAPGAEGEAEVDSSNRWFVYQDAGSDDLSLNVVDLTGEVEPRTFQFGHFKRLHDHYALFEPLSADERPLPPVVVDLLTGQARQFPAAPGGPSFWYGAIIDPSHAVVLGLDDAGESFIVRFATIAGEVVREHKFPVPELDKPIENDHDYSAFWAAFHHDTVKILAGEDFLYFSQDGQPKHGVADGIEQLREHPGVFLTRFRGGGEGFHAFSMLDQRFETLSGNELGLVYADGTTRVVRLAEGPAPVLATEVSVDRDHLVVVRRDSTVEIWTTADARRVDTFRLDEAPGWDWSGHLERSEGQTWVRMAGTEVRFGAVEINESFENTGAFLFRRDIATGRTASKHVPVTNDEEVLAVWLAAGKVVVASGKPSLSLVDIATGDRTPLPEDGFVSEAFVDGKWVNWTLKSFYLDHLVGTGELSEPDVPIVQGWHPSGQHWVLPFGDLQGDSLLTTSANGRFLVLKRGGNEKTSSVILRDRATGDEHVIFGEKYAHSLMFGTAAHFLADGLLMRRWVGEAYFGLFDSKPPHASLGSFTVTNAKGRVDGRFDVSNGLLVGVLGGAVPFTIDPIASARANATIELPSE